MKKINIIGANHFFNDYRPFEEPYGDPKKHFLLKQTPDRAGQWGNYDFYIDSFDLDFDGYVFLDVPEGKRLLPNKPTLGLLMEAYHDNMPFKDGHPQSTILYSKGFTDQFDKIITTNHPVQHRAVIKTQIGAPWFTTSHKEGIDFNFLRDNNIKEKKNKICMICSDRNDTLHSPRLVFAKKIKEMLGEDVDFFGRGIQNFDNIYDLLSTYEYCITFENDCLPNYFSEKLSDIFLCGTYPIYNGCTNVYDFFDKDALMAFDLTDVSQTVSQIRQILKDDLYTKNYDKIIEAKTKVLYDYNIFNLLAQNIDLEVRKKNTVIMYFDRHTEKLTAKEKIKTYFKSWLPGKIKRAVLTKKMKGKQKNLKEFALNYNRSVKLHDRCK